MDDNKDYETKDYWDYHGLNKPPPLDKDRVCSRCPRKFYSDSFFVELASGIFICELCWDKFLHDTDVSGLGLPDDFSIPNSGR
jgi:hypothetical protein